MHLVSTCVLLKISLYCGNKILMYLVDLAILNLVSCMVIMAGMSCEWWIMSCMLGSVVFDDEAFHVMT